MSIGELRLRAGRIEVLEATSRRDRRTFLRLPFRLYADDPDWVPPLNRDVRALLDTRHHPFYSEAEAAFFVASKDGRPAGRIAAIRNGAHNRDHDDRRGFFGFFESEDDQAVVGALVEAACGWLRGHALTSAVGPVSPARNYTGGLLVEGDPGPPYLMMPHNPPWYLDRLAEQGFEKAIDLLALLMQDSAEAGVARWRRIAERIRSRSGAHVRPIDMSRFEEEVRLILDIFNDAWRDNWGFVPMNEGELVLLAKELRPVFDPRFCGFVVVGGQDVGFHLALPDYNRVLIDMHGRLFPTGIFRLLAYKRRFDTTRELLMGVRQSHQSQGLDVLLYEHILDVSWNNGVHVSEASWVLETNAPMLNTMMRAGARPWRRYRMLSKAL